MRSDSNSMLYLALIMLAVLTVASLVLGWWYAKRARNAQNFDPQIEAFGVNTEADIVSKRSTKIDFSTLYFVKFQFKPGAAQNDTEIIEHEEQVPFRDYARIKTGDQITVRYLPGDPSQFYIVAGMTDTEGPGNLRMNSIILYAFGFVVLVLLIIVIYASPDRPSSAKEPAQTTHHKKRGTTIVPLR